VLYLAVIPYHVYKVRSRNVVRRSSFPIVEEAQESEKVSVRTYSKCPGLLGGTTYYISVLRTSIVLPLDSTYGYSKVHSMDIRISDQCVLVPT
jgi:hypothetical protein